MECWLNGFLPISRSIYIPPSIHCYICTHNVHEWANLYRDNMGLGWSKWTGPIFGRECSTV